MKNKNNSVQIQINKMNYEKYLKGQLEKREADTTQILVNHIKTYDLAFVTLLLINKLDLKEVSSEKGAWLVDKNTKTEDLYKRYKNKETFVEPITFSKTFLNLIIKK